MLVSSDRTTVISSLGWVDHGSVWVYSDQTADARLERLSLAPYLTLHAGRNDHVAVVHHFEIGSVAITVHRFNDMEGVLARATIRPEARELIGDAGVWEHVPRHYTASLRTSDWSDFGLITIDARAGNVHVDRFPWFDDQYDKDYQGIVGVAEVPGSDCLVVSVQRSSTLILHDPVSRNKIGEVKLARRGGNPKMYFRRTARELWVDDYDTLLRLDSSTWRILDSRRLQRAVGVGKFIGSFTMDPEEQVCVVARPFSSDVVAIDTRTFKPTRSCHLGSEPLEAAMLTGNRIVARDWKTGRTLRGELRRKWWFARR